ncbi:CVNH domain-containing protein [Sarocladium implicatum]|nr:CVNH domain-containing protein [Sarocladium implicatum]
MELFRLLLTWVLAATARAASTTSFSKSCQAVDGQFFGQDKVGFYCFTKNVEQYDYKFSLIDLRHCLANNNGALIGYKDGNYQKSCEGCRLKTTQDLKDGMGTCHLLCYCDDLDGKKHESIFDLGDVLENDDGRLVCYGYGGTREQSPPECLRNPKCDDGNPRLSP